jgi:hypothetical protein
MGLRARWLALTWEIAAIWTVVLMLGCVSAVWVFAGLRVAQEDAVRHERLILFLSGLREKIETDVRLGFDIGEDRGAQAQIDELLRKDHSLRSIELFDALGLSRASTDKGTVGEQVPADWMRAAGAAVAAAPFWTTDSSGADDIVLGVPIKGGFGEVAGHIAVTYAPLERGWVLAQVAGRYAAECLAALFALIMGASLWACYPYARRVHLQERVVWGQHSDGAHEEQALDGQRIRDATAVLADTRHRLERVSGQLDQTP